MQIDKLLAAALTSLFGACVATSPASRTIDDSARTPIATDRPGFSYAASGVPRGAYQLELGLPSFARDSNSNSLTAFTALARFGVTDTFEARVGATPFAHSESDVDGSREVERGTGDLELGFKLGLIDSGAALIATARLPTGEAPFTSEDPAYALAFVAETPLDEVRVLKGLIGWSRTPDGAGTDLDSAALAVTLSRALDDDIGAFAELAWFPALEHGPDPAYVGGGISFLWTADLQFDAGLSAALNDDATDLLATIGVSLRW